MAEQGMRGVGVEVWPGMIHAIMVVVSCRLPSIGRCLQGKGPPGLSMLTACLLYVQQFQS